MFKAVVLIKKKKGMSMKDFIEYYENNHAPLATRLVPNLKKYVRHFLTSYGDTSDEAPYDVITEIWFDDRADFDKGMAYLADPHNAALIAADEENLFERSSIRFLLVEDRETDLKR